MVFALHPTLPDAFSGSPSSHVSREGTLARLFSQVGILRSLAGGNQAKMTNCEYTILFAGELPCCTQRESLCQIQHSNTTSIIFH